jgi:hypothetical protein
MVAYGIWTHIGYMSINVTTGNAGELLTVGWWRVESTPTQLMSFQSGTELQLVQLAYLWWIQSSYVVTLAPINWSTSTVCYMPCHSSCMHINIVTLKAYSYQTSIAWTFLIYIRKFCGSGYPTRWFFFNLPIPSSRSRPPTWRLLSL